jgi:hypothetical protein
MLMTAIAGLGMACRQQPLKAKVVATLASFSLSACIWRSLIAAALVASLAGCASPPAPKALATQATASAAAIDPPPAPLCANHLTAARSDGTSAVYMGADPSDPAICLVNVSGTPTRSVWGSWTLRSFQGPTLADVKDAVAKLRSGPVGTKVQISWSTGSKGSTSNITTVERVPDETVTVGSQSYNCMVFHTTDNFGNEFVGWFDPKSRITLHSKGTYPSPYDWHVTAIAPSA